VERAWDPDRIPRTLRGAVVNGPEGSDPGRGQTPIAETESDPGLADLLPQRLNRRMVHDRARRQRAGAADDYSAERDANQPHYRVELVLEIE